MIKTIFLTFFLIISVVSAEEELTNNDIQEDIEVYEEIEPNVDCLILEDENSIICKFEATRNIEDKQIIVEWIDPNNELSRQRNMIIPAGHGSIYDYRYIKGREPGLWTFKVTLDDKSYSTQFELK